MLSHQTFRSATLICAGVFLLNTANAATPTWLRAQVGATMPAVDDKASAVLLYSETVLTVQPNGNIKKLDRRAYKILRPDGSQRGVIRANYDSQTRITAMKGWCIPASGKDYETKDKDAIESALIGIEHGELMSDLRTKLLQIPAAITGSIVGYEVEQEERPYALLDEWHFQQTDVVRETRYRLVLPKGWTYKVTWINHHEIAPVVEAEGQAEWVINNVKAVREEEAMPPWRGVAARMFVSLVPANGKGQVIQSWGDVGAWYYNLTNGRRESTPQIKKQVADLTSSEQTTLAKILVLTKFVQSNIRYVAIELGLGGYQPHSAADTFTNRFGDCKDKATLLHTMLKELGIESHYVIINTERGSIDKTTPASLMFNHVVLAIVAPKDLEDPSLLASSVHPKFGRLIFFDPTDELTPFGRLNGALQSNYGLLVTPEASELVELPRLPIASNAVERNAKMTLDDKGVLRGDIDESWVGDPAALQRNILRSAARDVEHIKPVEKVMAESFTSYQILKAAIGNLNAQSLPFEWHYSIEATNYAKVAGDLLLVRPRILGSKASGLLEVKEPRVHPIEFDRPQRDKDVFEIALPSGYVVDELPPSVSIEESFATYRSKTEVVGKTLRYTRTLEIRELSVPVDKAERLRQFYRTISGDERNLVVLKRNAP